MKSDSKRKLARKDKEGGLILIKGKLRRHHYPKHNASNSGVASFIKKCSARIKDPD